MRQSTFHLVSFKCYDFFVTLGVAIIPGSVGNTQLKPHRSDRVRIKWRLSWTHCDKLVSFLTAPQVRKMLCKATNIVFTYL